MLERVLSAIGSWRAVADQSKSVAGTQENAVEGQPQLLENACQAPAAVKIGVTLLFSEFSLQPAPASCRSKLHR